MELSETDALPELDAPKLDADMVWKSVDLSLGLPDLYSRQWRRQLSETSNAPSEEVVNAASEILQSLHMEHFRHPHHEAAPTDFHLGEPALTDRDEELSDLDEAPEAPEAARSRSGSSHLGKDIRPPQIETSQALARVWRPLRDSAAEVSKCSGCSSSSCLSLATEARFDKRHQAKSEALDPDLPQFRWQISKPAAASDISEHLKEPCASTGAPEQFHPPGSARSSTQHVPEESQVQCRLQMSQESKPKLHLDLGPGSPQTASRCSSLEDLPMPAALCKSMGKVLSSLKSPPGSPCRRTSQANSARHSLLHYSSDTRPWMQPEHVLLITDWDDTLLPTSWLASRPWFQNWARSAAAGVQAVLQADQDRELLMEFDEVVSAFVQTASTLGHLCCVTLAKRPWVERSMTAFLPKLAQVWKDLNISVSYAMEEKVKASLRPPPLCLKPAGMTPLEAAIVEQQLFTEKKRLAMHRFLKQFYASNSGSWCNVVSVGDGPAERYALQELGFWHHNPCLPGQEIADAFRIKTLQLLDNPSAEQLCAQLQVLETWMPALVSLDQDFDVTISGDETLMGTHHMLLALAEAGACEAPCASHS